MIKYIVITTLLLLMITHLYPQSNCDEIIDRSRKSISKTECISFTNYTKMKYFNSEDTIVNIQKCIYKRNVMDTLVGGKVHIIEDTSREYFCDRNICIYVFKSKKFYQIDDYFYTHKNLYVRFNGIPNSMFLETIPYSEIISNIDSVFLDTVEWEDHYCFALNFIFNDITNPDISKTVYYLDTFSFLPIGLESWIYMSGKLQYIKAIYQDAIVNNTCFDQNFYFDTNNTQYLKIRLKPKRSKFPFTLSVGQTAPDFILPSINGDTIVLSKIDDSYVILDFFFVGCKACKIVQQKIDSLLISNMNVGEISIDIVDKDAEMIRKYIKNKSKHNSVVMGDKKTRDDYRISLYPTIFILDNQKKIMYIQEGYKYGDELKWERILNSNFK